MLDHIKVKNFFSVRDPVFPQIKSETMDWEQIFVKHPDLPPRISEELSELKIKTLRKGYLENWHKTWADVSSN